MSADENSLEYIEDPYFNPKTTTETPSLDELDDIHDIVKDSSTEAEIDIFDLRQLEFDDYPTNKFDYLDESVNVEAEFVNVKRANTIIKTFFKMSPKKLVRVTYCDLTKPYKVKLTSDTNFRKYLGIVTDDEATAATDMRDFGDERSSFSAEEREKQEKEWRTELDQVEDEILTLRAVLAAKMRTSSELKRKLGITAWKEISDDVNQGLKNVKDSTVYQKTTSIIGGITGGISNKLGQIRHSESFRSIEEKASSAIENVKTKVVSRSSSQQSFSEETTKSRAGSIVTSPTIPEDKPLA